MQYPLITEYKTAVGISDSFDKLSHMRVVRGANGQPVFSAGGPAVVFKMHDPQKDRYYALKCFLKHQNNRKEHFDAVGTYLNQIESPYLCRYQYLEEEIWVETDTYPVLLMDWVEGDMMSLRVADLCARGDSASLRQLAYKFDAMGLWLMRSDLAHCDIKPDNIIVTPQGDLRLVDYDGMYVPSLRGCRSPELGTAEYRHPRRTASDFGSQLDDFPILVLSLSLHSLAKDPKLYDSTINGDALVFSRDDYRSLLTSKHISFFVANQGDEVIGSRFAQLMYSLNQPIVDLKELPALLDKTAVLAEPVCAEEEVLSTKVDSAEGVWVDSLGVKYSADRKKLICCPDEFIGNYTIPNGTKVICDWAFYSCSSLISITLPTSLTVIGNFAFSWCSSLESITLPASVTAIGDGAFSDCESLINVKIDGGNFIEEDGVLYNYNKTKVILTFPAIFDQHTTFTLPASVTAIGDRAFYKCSSLTSITLPNSLTTIGNGAFSYCERLTSITLPNSLTTIGKRAFYSCSRLINVKIDGGNFIEEDGVLYNYNKTRVILTFPAIFNQHTTFTLPASVTAIGDEAFYYCCSLRSITIPNSVTAIGDRAFEGCESLTSITLPASLTAIGKRAFYSCSRLTSITLPNSLTTIGDSAFFSCKSLTKITIPASVTAIGDRALSWCESLTSITLPASVTAIGDEAFSWCSSLTSVYIPIGADRLRSLLIDAKVSSYKIKEK